jgi:protein arginine kinase activator
MKCDLCENEATVHEVTVKSGVKVEKHLCESCARQQGISVQPSVPINELITKYVMAHAAPSAAPSAPAPSGTARATVCPTCGTTYAEFRQTGLLGCADCYKAFEAQLSPLLERAHEGATHHVGKLPRRTLAASRLSQGSGTAARGLEAVLGGAEERAKRLTAIRMQLDEAVSSEQYERAAKLRDELRRLSEMGAAREREKGA